MMMMIDTQTSASLRKDNQHGEFAGFSPRGARARRLTCSNFYSHLARVEVQLGSYLIAT